MPSFHYKNFKHVKTTVVGFLIIACALGSKFYPPEKPYASWVEILPAITIGLGCMGIGPKEKKGSEEKKVT